MSDLVNGLGPNGKLLVVGAGSDSLSVTPIQLIIGNKALKGWASGTARDSEDALNFSSLSNVRPMIERYPLAKAADAYQQMLSGKARFRVVLTMN
jgi:D-arabinose 1-dehydrogenase-like Zn-dependent alcohol dehydrogenase